MCYVTLLLCSEALLEVRYQPWYLYLTSLPKYKLVAGAAVTVTSLSLVLIIIVCSNRAGQYPQYQPADLVFPATACQTMQNISCIFPFSYKGEARRPHDSYCGKQLVACSFWVKPCTDVYGPTFTVSKVADFLCGVNPS